MYFTLLSPLSMKNGVLYPITQTLKERSNSLLLRDAVVTFANHGCRIFASVLVGYIITTRALRTTGEARFCIIGCFRQL